jgi:glycosyltransferase involved in cell wall biosynthesis
MMDFSVAWQSRGERWFVVPRPQGAFARRAQRTPVVELLGQYPERHRPTIVAPSVGTAYELGTEAYRASVYAAAIESAVPPGVPLIVSGDPAAWRAAASLADRYRFIGVLHSDDEAFYGLAERYATALSAVACVSRRIARRAEELLAGRDVPIEAIPCGTLLPTEEPSALRDGRGVPRLIWVGRMDEKQKRVSDLPRIAAALNAQGLEFQLDVVGSGPEQAVAASAFERLGVGTRVQMHGWAPPTTVDALLRRADVLLLPSNFEGMPMVIMEALGHGCGVVASRVSGVEDYEDVMQARGCFWVHGVGDVADATQKIIAAVETAPEIRVPAARRLAEAEFSIEVCVERYAALLDRPAPTIDAPYQWHTFGRRIAALASLPVAAQRWMRLSVAERSRPVPMTQRSRAHP